MPILQSYSVATEYVFSNLRIDSEFSFIWKVRLEAMAIFRHISAQLSGRKIDRISVILGRQLNI